MGQADWGNRGEWPKGHLCVWREQALDGYTEDASDAHQMADLRVRRATFEALDRRSINARPFRQKLLRKPFVSPCDANAVPHHSLSIANPLILFSWHQPR